jgi:hypothetical protein
MTHVGFRNSSPCHCNSSSCHCNSSPCHCNSSLVAATRLPVAATRLPVALARTLPLAATGADLARALSRALCSPLWAQQQRDTTSSSAYEVIKELDLQLEASQVQGLVLGVGGCWGLRVKI